MKTNTSFNEDNRSKETSEDMRLPPFLPDVAPVIERGLNFEVLKDKTIGDVLKLEQELLK